MYDTGHDEQGGFFRRSVLFPTYYTAFILASALDLMLTWIVIHIGGREANHFGAYVIENFDLPGVVAFKFALAALVIVICEFVGRRRLDLGLSLARLAIVVPTAGATMGVVIIYRLITS